VAWQFVNLAGVVRGQCPADVAFCTGLIVGALGYVWMTEERTSFLVRLLASADEAGIVTEDHCTEVASSLGMSPEEGREIVTLFTGACFLTPLVDTLSDSQSGQSGLPRRRSRSR
jgi:hypothetical protein